MDPWGPDQEGTDLGLERSWDPVAALACHRNQEALNKNGAWKERAFKGQCWKSRSQRLKEMGRLALGAEAHQTTVDWETKLLGLQPPWVKTQVRPNPTRSRPELVTNRRDSQLVNDYRLR